MTFGTLTNLIKSPMMQGRLKEEYKLGQLALGSVQRKTQMGVISNLRERYIYGVEL